MASMIPASGTLELLREAVRRVPGYMRDWPRRDPDLVALHGHPEFVAMIGQAGETRG